MTNSRSYAIKTSNYVRHNLESLLLTFGIGEGCSAFKTLTFYKKIRDLREANQYFRRYNELFKRRLEKLGFDYIMFRIAEPHKDKSWHFHCLIACPHFFDSNIKITTKILHDIHSDIKKSTKIPVGYDDVKWTYRTTDREIKGMKSYYAKSVNKTLWRDRTPSFDPEDIKGPVNYITKYVLKGLVDLKEDSSFIIPKGARMYSFSANFERKCSRKFTKLTPAFYDYKMWCGQVKTWFFSECWEKFYWHKYKSQEDCYKHNLSIREIIEKVKTSFSCLDPNDLDFLKSIFDDIADILRACPAVSEADILKDRETFQSRCLRLKREDLSDFMPLVSQELKDSDVSDMLHVFNKKDFRALIEGDLKVFHKLKNFLLPLKDCIKKESIKDDLQRLKMLCFCYKDGETIDHLIKSRDSLVYRYLKDVPF